MTDDFDGLTDDALLEYLTDQAGRGGMRLVIEEHDDRWIAETRAASGLGGSMQVLVATGPDRRSAMLGLAQQLRVDAAP
jgi:hypothetical protein